MKRNRFKGREKRERERRTKRGENVLESEGRDWKEKEKKIENREMRDIRIRESFEFRGRLEI